MRGKANDTLFLQRIIDRIPAFSTYFSTSYPSNASILNLNLETLPWQQSDAVVKPVAGPISWNSAQLSRLQMVPGSHPFLFSARSQSEQKFRMVRFGYGIGKEVDYGLGATFWV